MYNNTQQRFFHFWSAVVQTIGNWCARSLPRFLGQQRMSVLGISNKVMFHRLHGAFPLTRTHTRTHSIRASEGWMSDSKRVEVNIRILTLKAGWVLRCGCGAATGRCRPRRSGSSPAAYLRGKPPPPDGPRPRGFPPPAAAGWPPAERLWTPHWAESRSVRPHLWLFWQLELQTAERILRLGLLADLC